MCDFDAADGIKRSKELRRGTRAGSIAVYCAREGLADAGHDLARARPFSRIGIYTRDHRARQRRDRERGLRTSPSTTTTCTYWSHHHNPAHGGQQPRRREITLNLGITGPAYCLGGACAAGNLGHHPRPCRCWQLGEVCDVALGGRRLRESIHTFGIFASFQSQGALAKRRRPDQGLPPVRQVDRNGIVVSEGGCRLRARTRATTPASPRRTDSTVAAPRHVRQLRRDSDFGAAQRSEGQNACMRGALRDSPASSRSEDRSS